MERDIRREALEYLLRLADKQGYVTFDNIIDCAGKKALSIQNFDWLANSITTKGIIVYDEAPSVILSGNEDEEDYNDFAQSDYEAVFDRAIQLSPALRPFISIVRNIKPPQYREFGKLKYQVQEGNIHARNRIIEMHLRMAVKIALQRAEVYDMDIEDALGYACLGLVTAVDKFDPDSGMVFAPYANLWMLQNISREQSTQSYHVYYPVHKKEGYYIVYPELKKKGCISCDEIQTCSKLRQIICEKLNCTFDGAEDIVGALVPWKSYDVLVEYFMEVNDDVDDYLGQKIIPKMLYTEDIVADILEKSSMINSVRAAVKLLKPKEQEVIISRYGLYGGTEKTLEEVGSMNNITRERVRQIEKKALIKLSGFSYSKYFRDFI